MIQKGVILIIDKRIEGSLKYKRILQNEHQSVFIGETLGQSLKFIQDFEPDLILISDSINEPLADFCKKIRTLTFNYRPVIIALSKSSHIQDKLGALESGADDFLSEPMAKCEFAARINAHLRRHLETNTDENGLIPDNKTAFRVLKRNVNFKGKYCVLNVEINNFMRYKEAYGELAAQKALQTFCAIVESVLDENDFLSRLSTGSFMIIVPSSKGERLASFLIYAFDAVKEKFYSKEDVNDGFLILHGNEKEEAKSPFMSLSIGALNNENGAYNDFKVVIASLFNALRLAKQNENSSCVIDRPKLTGDVTKCEVNKKVLIIECDSALSFLLEEVSHLKGLDVIVKNNYQEIDEFLKTYNPAIIILDAGEGPNFEGIELCSKIKSEHKNIKVILTTILHDKKRILSSGADLYLPKPYDIATVFGWIDKFLKSLL